MRYEKVVKIIVKNPDGSAIIDEWIDNDKEKCAPHRMAVSMNEACGGCIGCMEMQAVHCGNIVERVDVMVKRKKD